MGEPKLPYLTVPETAVRLRLGVQTVRDLIRAGKLAALRLGLKGGRVFVTEAAIADYLRRAGGAGEGTASFAPPVLVPADLMRPVWERR